MTFGVPERGATLSIVVLDRDLTSKDDVIGEKNLNLLLKNGFIFD